MDWERGRPAAWDVSITSPLTPAVLNEAGVTAGAAAAASEHIANDPKYQELGWVCVPLEEKHTTFTRLATRLAICVSLLKSRVTADLYGRFSLVLVRCIARATHILTRSLPHSFE